MRLQSFFRLLSSTFLVLCFAQAALAQQNNADILLAQVYQRGIAVEHYLVSEKYDGVRALWDLSLIHI